jgi:exopolysaccharide production protein ExoY
VKIAVAAKSVSERTYLLQEVGSCDAAACGDALAITLHDGARHREFVTTEQPNGSRANQWVLRKSSNEPVFAPREPDSVTLEPKFSLVATTKARLSGRPIGGLTKRVLDIAVASVALVLLAPLLLLVALLIRLTMGSPVIFSHTRLGYGGRSFACLKFRTMVNDADTALQDHLVHNSAAREEWQIDRKLRSDPRVTRLGSILRRSSIDELPQLFNVLMGHMSCVGPRPIVAAEVPRYGRAWEDYTKACPGMTGLWQVSGRNRLGYRTRVALDRRYVRRWSAMRDVWILMRTVPAVLRTDDTA